MGSQQSRRTRTTRSSFLTITITSIRNKRSKCSKALQVVSRMEAAHGPFLNLKVHIVGTANSVLQIVVQVVFLNLNNALHYDIGG